LISPNVDVLKTLTVPAPAGAIPAVDRLPSENCAKIRDLGFKASKRMKMYGERFEVVSDPLMRTVA
jgi:predicted dinucleotide-utilizing enzyme